MRIMAAVAQETPGQPGYASGDRPGSAGAAVSRARQHMGVLVAPLLLVVLYGVVRYFHSPGFGLYEDDLTHLPSVFGMSFGEVLRYAFDPGRIMALREQGHPLHNTFIYLLSAVGWRLGGLSGAYLIGFGVQALNILLFYFLLYRIHSRSLAIMGGLVYALYAADTTQTFLTYSLGIHPSITFLLLALHAYLSRLDVLSYLLATLALLTYETAYLPFLAAPLLRTEPVSTRRRWLVHAGVVVSVLVVFVILRIRTGDDRVLALQGMEFISRPVRNTLLGVATSLGSYLYRPYEIAIARNAEAVLVSLLAFVVFFFVLARLALALPLGLDRAVSAWFSGGGGPSLSGKARRLWSELPHEVKDLIRIAAAGALMLALAYPIMLTVRPYAISGRDTRVHSAGVVGASILLGSMLLLVLWIAQSLNKRSAMALPLAAWLALLAGYGFVIQRDYVMAWQYQRDFWRELLPLIPDVGEGNAVLVDSGALRDTRQIGANYWNMPIVLEQLYQFPDSWERPPRVYRLSENWKDGIMRSADTVTLNGATTFATPSTYYYLLAKDALLIDERDGTLIRLVGQNIVDRREVWLRGPGQPTESPYPKKLLYGLMLGDEQPG